MTYEYVCTACSHGWEAEQSISAPALKTCPSCHEQTAKRQVSGGAGFILKGGGWYADLYSSAKPGKKDDAPSEKKAETKKADASTSGASGTSTSGASDGGSSSSTTAATTTPAKSSAAAAS